MEVRIGWATEFGRDKFDVSVDEVDLRRILADSRDPAFPDLDDALAALISGEAFYILKLHAQRLSKLATLDLVTDEAQRTEIIKAILALKNEEHAHIVQHKQKLGITGSLPDAG